MKRTALRLSVSLCLTSIVGLAAAPRSFAEPQQSDSRSAVASAQAQGGTPREVLPDLGQIGAEVSLVFGISTNPFAADRGLTTGGYIDLPIFRVAGGKLSYQIGVVNHTAKTDVRITSPLSAVGDLLAADGLGNTLTSRVLSSLKNMPAEEDLDLLAVLPFGMKYTVMSLDHLRVRPYLVAATGVYVTITEQNPHLTVDPRLAGTFIGGIAPQAVELTARGVPEGQGDIRFGVNAGGGLEVRVASRGSLGAEYRFHKIEASRNATFSTFVAKLAFHF
jgi:opacity protein-like surface antigen